MNTIRILAVASTGLLPTLGAALAHEMDADQDGLHRLAELQTEFADLAQEQYDALDTNADGAAVAVERAVVIENGTLPAMD